jgi:lipopolysaccharide/colanic/teichoic acid biosynthesis glycosyltransferase
MLKKPKPQERLVLETPIPKMEPVYRPQNFTLEEWIRIDTRKRTMDIIVSGAGIAFLLPFLPIIIMLIKFSSPGPVFFKQIREGEGGKPFLCYKLRTMHIGNQEINEDKPDITTKGDSRIFKFGQFLREKNLDEFPQLYNVLRGDMSLVGPRPYMVSETQYWKEEFHSVEFELREQVRPGISGLAQVNGYRGGILDKDHMRKRLEYDLVYVQSYDTALDMKIISKTLSQMIFQNTNAH